MLADTRVLVDTHVFAATCLLADTCVLAVTCLLAGTRAEFARIGLPMVIEAEDSVMISGRTWTKAYAKGADHIAPQAATDEHEKRAGSLLRRVVGRRRNVAVAN